MIMQNHFLRLAFILTVALTFGVSHLIPHSFASGQKTELSNQSLTLKLKDKIKKIEEDKSLLLYQKNEEEKKGTETAEKLRDTLSKRETIPEGERDAMALSIKSLQQDMEQHSVRRADIDEKINRINNELKSINEQLRPLEKAEILVQRLKKEGFLPESSRIEKVTNPNTTAAESIIFIKNNNSCPTVVKVFQEIESFVSEHKNMTRGVPYANLVNELRKKCGYPLPIIVGPKGGIVIDKVGIMLLEKAQGKPIADYIDNIPSMADERIKILFSKMGEQFGELDALMLKNVGELLIHKDSHANNFFYDEGNNQVYWIDTAGSDGLQMVKSNDGLKLLVFVSRPLGKYDFTGSLNLSKIKSGYSKVPKNDKDKLEAYYKLLRKRMLAIQSFAQGYYNKNRQPDVETNFNKNNSGVASLKSVIEQVNEDIKSLKLNFVPLDFDRDYAIK